MVAGPDEALQALADGRVRVGGMPDPKPNSLVDHDVDLRIEPPSPQYVSRGGDKLEGALISFGLSVEGHRAIDVGASSGGFTDCLLQRDASSVVAVDVGYGQLAWNLRTDPRVSVLDRTNIRHADPAALGAPFDLVVADLSFISLLAVARALKALGEATTDYVLLVKPQFEAAKEDVGAGGVVRDPATHRMVLAHVIEGLMEEGLGVIDVCRSPLEGIHGNREFFLWARSGPTTVTSADVEAVI